MWETSSAGGEHLALVDVIDLDGLQNLRFDEMADPNLGNDRDRYGVLNPFLSFGVAHPRYAAGRADIGGNALKRHNGARARILGDLGLFRCRYIHDDAALDICARFLLSSYRLFISLFSVPSIEIIERLPYYKRQSDHINSIRTSLFYGTRSERSP
jgi:hypothetical protein